MTNKFLAGIALTSAIVLGTASAQATTLTFNTTADCSTSEVTITKGYGNSACQLGSGPGGPALVGSNGGGSFELDDSFWTAVFSQDVMNVSVDLGDFNQDADRLFIWAWDASDSFLASIEVDIASTFEGMQTLSLAISGIRSIVFGTISASAGGLGLGGIFADNLTYTTAPSAVPVPAALPLLASGLAGLGLLGWRRKRATKG